MWLKTIRLRQSEKCWLRFFLRNIRLCAVAKTMVIRKIFLTGEGEPMLHPRILEMVSAAKTAGRSARYGTAPPTGNSAAEQSVARTFPEANTTAAATSAAM